MDSEKEVNRLRLEIGILLDKIEREREAGYVEGFEDGYNEGLEGRKEELDEIF